MKRANHLLSQISDPDNLRLAFWKARKGKNHSREVQAFCAKLDSNLLDLRTQILEASLEVGDYRYFKIYDPKEREICASSFRENVLHHAIMNICHEYFERFQIFDSYASRKGKGTYAAIARAKAYTQSHKWFVKLDVRKFFASIHHEVLKTQLRRMFKEKNLLKMFDQIIDSYENDTNRGLPIGNLSSQYFANHYLAGLDHFVKEKLRIKAYTRYMDDMVLWHQDKHTLKNAALAINEFVEGKLRCRLNPDVLSQTRYGLPFLGYLIYPQQVRLTQRSKRRFIRKIHNLEDKYHSGEWDESTCQRRVLPLLAFIQHADTLALRKSIILHTGISIEG